MYTVSSSKASTSPLLLLSSSSSSASSLPNSIGINRLRHNSDFTFLSLLGRGGFGSVYLARQLIDSRIYAIKRIALKHTRADHISNQTVLREASLLSGVNHENVVRYYNAWIEGGEDEEEEDGDEEEEEEEETKDSNSARQANIDKSSQPVVNKVANLTSDTTTLTSIPSSSVISERNLNIQECNSVSDSFDDDMKEFSISACNLRDSLRLPPFSSSPSNLSLYDKVNDEDNDNHKEYEFDAETSNIWSSTSSSPTSPSLLNSTASVDDDIPEVQCGVCNIGYHDWSVSCSDWSILELSLQPLNLCQQCYVLGLQQMGVSVDKANIRMQLRQKRQLYLYIQMEACDTNLEAEIQKVHSIKIKQQTSKSISQDSIETHSVDDNHDQSDTLLWSYFTQLTKALTFLHSQHYIHRDIKPSNVLIAGGTIKLGDLGLATRILPGATEKMPTIKNNISNNNNNKKNDHFKEIQVVDNESNNDKEKSRSTNLLRKEKPLPKKRSKGDERNNREKRTSRITSQTNPRNKMDRIIGNDNVAPQGTAVFGHSPLLFHSSSRDVPTVGIGTSYYIAPEVLKNGSYDEKCDIYSLGIILFELFWPFSTRMERSISLDRLCYAGQLPKDFQEKYPIQAKLINVMMSIEPNNRPTAEDILLLLQQYSNKKLNRIIGTIDCDTATILTTISNYSSLPSRLLSLESQVVSLGLQLRESQSIIQQKDEEIEKLKKEIERLKSN